MTETVSKIYYHKPRIRKTGLRKESLDRAYYDLLHMTMEEAEEVKIRKRTPDPDFSDKNRIAVPDPECIVPESSVVNCCTNILRSFGLTGKYDGYDYICSAVEEILKIKEPPHFQSIYYDIGKKFDVNSTSVERSIRYSINYIKRSGNRNSIAAVFGEAIDDEKNFSNSKFLTIIAADIYEKLVAVSAE